MEIFVVTYGNTDGEYGHFLTSGQRYFTTLEKAKEYGKQLEKDYYYRNILDIPEELLFDNNEMLDYYKIEKQIVE